MPVHNAVEQQRIAERTTRPIEPRTYGRLVLLQANETVRRGQGLCYLRNYGTATAREESRDWRVALPTQANSFAFAGVACKAYDSRPYEQWIEIYEPPSICLIEGSRTDTLTYDSILTCCVSYTGDTALQGQFFYKASSLFPGRGSARVLQQPAGSDNLCLAELLDGPESGLIDYHSRESHLSTGGAQTITPYGLTMYEGPAAPATDVTGTLADGKWIGARKMFQVVSGNIAVGDVVITVTNGMRMDGTTALATLAIDSTNEYVLLEWTGFTWALRGHSGATFT